MAFLRITTASEKNEKLLLCSGEEWLCQSQPKGDCSPPNSYFKGKSHGSLAITATRFRPKNVDRLQQSIALPSSYFGPLPVEDQVQDRLVSGQPLSWG
jgi:cytoplasmic iron level regulating protein YaaA (DUF328/UPF0246 family)